MTPEETISAIAELLELAREGLAARRSRATVPPPAPEHPLVLAAVEHLGAVPAPPTPSGPIDGGTSQPHTPPTEADPWGLHTRPDVDGPDPTTAPPVPECACGAGLATIDGPAGERVCPACAARLAAKPKRLDRYEPLRARARELGLANADFQAAAGAVKSGRLTLEAALEQLDAVGAEKSYTALVLATSQTAQLLELRHRIAADRRLPHEAGQSLLRMVRNKLGYAPGARGPRPTARAARSDVDVEREAIVAEGVGS